MVVVVVVWEAPQRLDKWTDESILGGWGPGAVIAGRVSGPAVLAGSAGANGAADTRTVRLFWHSPCSGRESLSEIPVGASHSQPPPPSELRR